MTKKEKNFEQVEEKILNDRQYLLNMLQKVQVNDSAEFSVVGGTVSKISEVLCRMNSMLLEIERARLAIKKSEPQNEDYTDIANAIPVQFNEKVS